jgi:phage-related protein
LLGDTDLSDIASDVIDTFQNGLSNAWDNITDWASGAVSRLKNTISNAVSWVKDKVRGSHRTGLREVPYDGYIAELHKGE